MPVIYLTGAVATNYTWIVPFDWNDNNNQIICIGAGANGVGNGGAGGGGGAYAQLTNVNLTPGAVLYYRRGNPATTAGGSWLNITGANSQPASLAQGCYAEGGQGTVGGRASVSFGNFTSNGGSAGAVAGSGGGGAGGTTNNGTSSAAATPSAGGAGGTLNGGNGGTAVGTGTAGAGQAGTAFAATLAWSPTAQSYSSSIISLGAGGGGGGVAGTGGGVAGAGGLYGGGGGGANTTKTAGVGAEGGIIIVYTPSSPYSLPASGPISMADINSAYFSSGTPRTLGEPEVRYLLESGTFNQNFMPLPAQSNVDFNAGRSKPVFTSTTATFTTPGTYTFYLPAYKTIQITAIGAGGGEGGSGCPTTTCSGGLLLSCCGYSGSCFCNYAPYVTNCTICPSFCFCQLYGCNASGTTYNYGNTGQTGGTTSVSVGGATILQGSGGTGGTGGAGAGVDGANGTNGSGSFGAGYSGSTSTVSNGGTGITNGGAGGGGGKAITAVTHYVGTYFVWANTTAVTTLTIVVGAGGVGGTGNTVCATQITGATGGNGSVTIEWN